ncbi:bifunctional methylenetetrahydrofolate dehydrogenase/cyclohydrolase 2, mitochondrial-like [Muntiacus reevesi]|uniref:bifunctional methylenetetrahydrofolate dehydrogenase/cyclohydrolase 2, mitochondrial-like n=1 Tax=Muntiacus reevesi TaxID=9886 RepID=UPI003306B871
MDLEEDKVIPKLITSDMVKEGATVIDVGINYIHDPITGKTKLVGDVDFKVILLLGYIIVTVCLLQNHHTLMMHPDGIDST